jgi:hypothetical protein
MKYSSDCYKKFYQINKQKINKNHREYYHKNKEKRLKKIIEYRIKNKNKLQIAQRKYQQTEKGKMIESQKQARRKRELGFNPIISNILDEKIVWHHIDNENVIPLPKDIHEHFYNPDVITHRENLISIIGQIYPNSAYQLSLNQNDIGKEMKGGKRTWMNLGIGNIRNSGD